MRAENKEKHWDYIKLCKKTINEHDGEWMQRKVSEMKRIEDEDELEKKEMRFQKLEEKREFQAEVENKQTLEEKVKQLREEGRLDWESIKRKEIREIKETKNRNSGDGG